MRLRSIEDDKLLVDGSLCVSVATRPVQGESCQLQATPRNPEEEKRRLQIVDGWMTTIGWIATQQSPDIASNAIISQF